MNRIVTVFMVLVAAACSVHAQSWVSPADGSWGSGGNWDGGIVPLGSAPLWFTNEHSGTLTITLDGPRTNAADVAFNRGEWSLTPGIPANSSLVLNGARIITVDEGSVAFQAPVLSMGTSKIIKRGQGSVTIDAPWNFLSGAVPTFEAGVTRVTADGAIYTAANKDLYVDGTATLILDGGEISTKIIRLGQDVLADGALFQMNSGMVNCVGSGGAVLLVGYTAGAVNSGSARAEILGGTFSATGLVADASIIIGTRQPATLVVNGTNGTPAVVNVGFLLVGWKDSANNNATTNAVQIGSNAVVTASVKVACIPSKYTGTLELLRGGVLRTPDLYADAGTLDFNFAGGTLEMLAPNSAGLFRGPLCAVNLIAESTLIIDTNDVLLAQRLSGSEKLNIVGDGTLTFGGDQGGFSGTLARDAGTVLVTNILNEGGMSLMLGGDAVLNAGANPVLAMNLVVAGDISVTSLVADVVFKSVDLQGGKLTVGNGLDLVVEAMHIDAGTNVTVFSSGHVVLYALSGGGTLTVAGGGTFEVLDQSALVADGGSVVAADGTTLNTAVSVLSELNVWSDMTLSSAAKLTVSNLTFHGGALTWTGGAELEALHVVVSANATAGIVLQGAGSVVTNISTFAVADGSVFEINPGAGVTLSVGALSGSGTFRLNGGVLSVAHIASGLNVDINAGSVAVAAPSAPTTPVWISGEPAFWVDASEPGSLIAGGNLEWRDKRYSLGVYTNSAVAVGDQPALLANELNGKSVLKFASPASATSYKGMVWNQRLTNIRTVFWVVGAQEGGGMLLGDESLIDFLRGELLPYRTSDYPPDTPYTALFSTRFADGNRDNLRDVRNGVTRMNGTVYDSFQKGFPSPGYHVIALRTADDTVAKAFASERISSLYYNRSGCQRLAEVLVFTNALSDAEILETENYLQKKWFGGDVTLESVRLGASDASFHVTGGSARINALKLDAVNIEPLSALSGIAKIEQFVVGVNGYTLSNQTQTALPFNALDVQVKNGCVVTADLTQATSPYLTHLSGDGHIVLDVAADLHVGGIAVAADEGLSVEGNAVTLQADYLYALNAVAFAGFSESLMGRAYAYSVADISASAAMGLSLNWLTASGQLSFSGGTDAYVAYLDMEPRALQLNVAETAQVEIHDLYGRNTLTKTGNGQTTCSGAISVNDTDFTMSDVFGSIAEVLHNNRTFTLSGTAPYLIGTYNANSDTTKNLVFNAGASARIDTLNNNTGGSARFYLKAVDATGLHIENINFGANKNMAFPVGQTTTIANLRSVLGNATYLYGGMLNVTGSVVNVDKLVLFNQAGYFSEGVSLPDNKQLTLNLFEARANINAVVDLGENSVLSLNSGVKIEAGATVTFVNGTLRLKTPLTSGTELRLIDTAVEVASGGVFTPISLVGTGSVAVAVGGAVDVAETYGFTGTVDNEGGSVTLGTSRTNVVPVGPVGSPSFWVDASQAGSLLTNGANKLEWLDKRTVRDGTPGLNKATSLVRMPVIMSNELNGLPVVDFGTLGSTTTDERGMLWTTRLTDVRAVHWVIGAQNGGGQLLGDFSTGDIDYFRYHDTVTPPAGSVYSSPLWAEKFRTRTGGYVANVLNGDTRINTIPGWTNGFPSADYHLVSIRTAGTTRGGAFASERVNKGYGTRSGAQRLGEVLVYSGVTLTSAEQEANDAYLSGKWFRRSVAGYRLRDEGLLLLNGSGTFTGALVSASEIHVGDGGMNIEGDLLLGYTAAQPEGTRLIVEKLPAAGEASIAVSGALFLSDKGRVTLLERKAGVYTLLESSGLLTGAENLSNWVVDALPGFTTKLVVEGNALQIHIMPKGTMVQFL